MQQIKGKIEIILAKKRIAKLAIGICNLNNTDQSYDRDRICSNLPVESVHFRNLVHHLNACHIVLGFIRQTKFESCDTTHLLL